ncbi:MAG: A/G-specific adenine glycosylase [Kangiella sp.]|nr:MAG: A/G-specific adenine glycosylase [Kangiella sp.]
MLNFYDQFGRKDLPWQINKTAYSVWVSEIMLQQTQVKTVIPYYLRFMKSFKSVEELADANIDEVLKHWEGLGYYSRARNLHACAKQVVADFNSKFPETLNEIISLPGIGESTGGAILSLAYGLPEAILDGNVKRVLARVFLVDGWYGNAKVSKELWQISRKYTPNKRTGDFNQAMMDLGAGICNRSNPQCDICPLSKQCEAHLKNLTIEYPHRKPKKAIPTREVTMLLNSKNNIVLLHKRPPSGIWGGLWSLPEQQEVNQSDHKLTGKFKHTFSHYHLNATVVSPIRRQEKNYQVEENNGLAWHNVEQITKLALPAPIKKFLYKHFEIKED